jgi:hypothetical protein
MTCSSSRQLFPSPRRSPARPPSGLSFADAAAAVKDCAPGNPDIVPDPIRGAQLGEKAPFILTDSGDFDTKTQTRLARVEQALLPPLKSWSLGFDEGMALAGP